MSSEKKEFPLKTLDDIIDVKRKRIARNKYCKSAVLAQYYDIEKVEFLEAIFNILTNIDERLKVLENKEDTCYRCGRGGHYLSECYASYNADGYKI